MSRNLNEESRWLKRSYKKVKIEEIIGELEWWMKDIEW